MAFLALVRPFTLLAPVVGTACAAGVAAASLDRAWASWSLLFACLSAVAATAASNAWNQVFDVEIDAANKPHRPVASGALSRGRAMAIGHAAAVVAVTSGAFATPAFLACVLVGLVATWIYSAPPLRTKRRTYGALWTIAIPRGLLVPVAGWSVVAWPTSTDPWALGLVAGLYVWGAAATKDFTDVEGDRADGCRTLPILLGPVRAARRIAPFLVLPFALYPVLGLVGWLHADLSRLVLLAVLLVVGGAFTAWALRRDAEGLAAGRAGHAAWIGMYLTLLASQVGTLLVYAL